MRCRAFTLLEMLLATALTAMLLTAVLAVSAALARDARRLSARPDGAWSDAVFDLLRFDLLNASHVESGERDRQLLLIGHCGLDGDTLRPTGRLARVAYRIRSDGWLVREQRYVDDPAQARPTSALVLSGARRIETTGSEKLLKIRIELTGGNAIERSIMVR